MKITGEINNTEEISVTLCITMKMQEWNDLREELSDRYPNWKLKNAITDASLKLNQRVTEEIEAE